ALHLVADPPPLRGLHLRMDAAVDDDLRGSVGEQQVNQDAVVLLGVPHAQQREYLERAAARRLAGEQRTALKRRFDREADLAAMSGFGFLDGLLDVCERGGRKGALHRAREADKVSQDAGELHQRPDAPPPPKLPPPPLKPPPPPSPPPP